MRRIAAGAVVERMDTAPFGSGSSLVGEEVRLEAIEGDRLEESRGNDPVGVDVVPAQDQRGTGHVR